MGFYNKYHSIVANCGGVAGISIFSGGPDGTLNIMGNHPLILDIHKFWYLGLGPYFGEKNDFFKGRKLNFPTPIRNMRTGINYQKIIKEN
jgi:hypothetical protein